MKKMIESYIKLSIGDLTREGLIKKGKAHALAYDSYGRDVLIVKGKLIKREEDEVSVDLKYKLESGWEVINYRLVSIPSNLGKGKTWYFVCNKTNKRCKKLYLSGRDFVHREALYNARYYMQNLSSDQRTGETILRGMRRAESVPQKINQSNFKVMYNGKFTKKAKALMKHQEKFPPISFEEMCRLLGFDPNLELELKDIY